MPAGSVRGCFLCLYHLKILEFHIEILGSSARMTKKVRSGDDILGNSRIFVIASEAKQSLGILEFIYGILNSSLEILNLFLEF